jgi:DNA mismatch repair protein MutS2
VPEWHEAPLEVDSLIHPILVQSRPVVANSFGFEHALILSGPNTGGKTVLLKALGLSLLMAEVGCLIPAKKFLIPNSLHGIRANIGDEQSLDLNLSTFSGHLLFLNELLKESRRGDLVLIDEIATGTSPEEGQPLAQAIIEKLLEKGVLLLVTTHYGGLKQFALIDDRCRVAAMTFDKASQKPTFKIEMDIPGESSAFDVAQQLGLPREVVDRARALRGEVSVDLNKAIEKLEKARKDYAQKVADLEFSTEKARVREQTAQEKIMELEAKMRAGVQVEAREEIKKFNQLREELSNLIKKSDSTQLVQNAQNLFGKISEAQDKVRSAIEGSGVFDPGSRAAEVEDLAPDTVVEVEGFGMGFVVDHPRDFKGPKTSVRVQVGDLQLSALLSKIRIPASRRAQDFRVGRSTSVASREKKLQEKVSVSRSSSGSSSKICDIRGRTVDEGMRKVEAMLNELAFNEDAVLSVIHGHGTDRLKDAVRTYVEKERSDLKYRSGTWPGEGGDGVTVIERRK